MGQQDPLGPAAVFRAKGPPRHLHFPDLPRVSLLAECGLGTPSKGILGNVAPADLCGHTTQPPGVVGCFLFFGVLLHFTGA